MQKLIRKSSTLLQKKHMTTETTPKIAFNLFHESKHTADYAQFRPTYPKELFDKIVNLCDKTDVCADIGCGSGQATIPLTKYFTKVKNNYNKVTRK